MPAPSVSRRLLWGLLAAGVLLPIVLALVAAAGWLLGSLGDAAGAAVLRRVGMGLGIAWAADLICLVLLHALATVEADRS